MGRLKPDKELFQLAVNAEIEVYKNNIDLGTTEYRFTETDRFYILAITGSNEKADWRKNFNLRWKRGFKKVGYDAYEDIIKSMRISESLNLTMEGTKNILVVCHSKSGVTGAVFAHYLKRNKNAHVVCFAPAPSILVFGIHRKTVFHNMTRFVDPDDIVHTRLAGLIYKQPIVPEGNEIVLPNNHFGHELSDHGLDNFKRFIDDM